MRVWDVPAARLLQTLRFNAAADRNVVTGMALSPAMDMLATTHEGRRGVYLWANSAMYAPARVHGPLDGWKNGWKNGRRRLRR